jgi:hypothetical protein
LIGPIDTWAKTLVRFLPISAHRAIGDEWVFGFSVAELIGWFVLTVIAGLVMWASQAPRDGANSKLSRWMGVFSSKGLPIAAWRPSFDRFAKYGALGIWGTGTLLLALNYLFDQRVIVRYEAAPLLLDQQFHFNAYLTNRGVLNDARRSRFRKSTYEGGHGEPSTTVAYLL